MKRYLLPLLALALASDAAQAETFTYKCGRHTIRMDDTAGTVSWDGHVYSNGQIVEGCKYTYAAYDRIAAIIKLCFSTKGVASVQLFSGEDGSAPQQFDCQQTGRPR